MWYLAVSLGEGELQASVGVTKPSVFVGATGMYWGNTSTASKIMKYIDRRLENLLSDLFLLTHIIHMHTYIRIYVCTYVYTYVIMHLRMYVRTYVHTQIIHTP